MVGPVAPWLLLLQLAVLFLVCKVEAYNHPYQQQNRHPPYQPQQRHQTTASHQQHLQQQQQQQQQQQRQQQLQQQQQQRYAAQQNHPNRYPPQKPAYQQNTQSPNSVTAYDTPYPAYPHHIPQQQTPTCDIPPDLWCDSPQSAQTCNVQRQCDTLKRSHKKLKISLMYEALCPYCQKFIANQLGTIVNQFRGQFELELVPWGNARIARDGQFSCNHGKKECDANRLQSCVIDILGTQQALPFIVCFERALGTSSVDASINQCMAFVRNQHRQIRHCYDSARGMQLQREAAQKTMSSRPNAILEVPYLLINDYTPDQDTNNLNVLMLPQLLQKWVKLYRK
ncbi:unnamed protein product, partial [Mesorhabditis spiculigera]